MNPGTVNQAAERPHRHGDERRSEPATGPRTRIRVAFLIRSLGRGGAERQLVTLATAMDRSAFEVVVFTFYAGGVFRAELEGAGIRVVSADKRGRWDLARFFRDLIRGLRAFQPHILHAYAGTPNMASVALKRFLPGTRIVWGVRAAEKDLSRHDLVSRLSARAEGRLSRFADLVIANSRAGRSHCVRRGFPEGRIEVIPNGIHTDRFQPDPEGRRRIRAEWGVPDGVALIGIVGRMNPMKNHAGFLRAAARLAEGDRNVWFACVGDGPEGYVAELRAMADGLGLSGRLVWAGARTDMAAVYSAFDIATLASVTEGFPNVVAEAMACGVRCVSTDVGDAAWIVGPTGIIVPPSDEEALAGGWSDILAGRGYDPREAPRERIIECFSVDALRTTTEETLIRVLGGPT